ncbi:hypothetical protein [Dyadobacter sp. NIV53]|nr:hypothetical protein [Dyadobacter sp. NIV53]
MEIIRFAKQKNQVRSLPATIWSFYVNWLLMKIRKEWLLFMDGERAG